MLVCDDKFVSQQSNDKWRVFLCLFAFIKHTVTEEGCKMHLKLLMESVGFCCDPYCVPTPIYVFRD